MHCLQWDRWPLLVPWGQGTLSTKPNIYLGPVQGGTLGLARHPNPNIVSAPPRKRLRARHVSNPGQVWLWLVLTSRLPTWQVLTHLKPTKSLGPKRLEAHSLIRKTWPKQGACTSTIRTSPVRRGQGIRTSGPIRQHEVKAI
jgi:hypothetical protein